MLTRNSSGVREEYVSQFVDRFRTDRIFRYRDGLRGIFFVLGRLKMANLCTGIVYLHRLMNNKPRYVL